MSFGVGTKLRYAVKAAKAGSKLWRGKIKRNAEAAR
ncbi:hypothetical protein JOF29_002805 [Kribbella aluminosa]|uniref:Uncharacterized protein n=1 Tax=Kribbella aluminosa TaxID=416017 RepID=A0ABS4UJ87_9ACTN|nr:hypothetical protein [Kribbella aluminosa]